MHTFCFTRTCNISYHDHGMEITSTHYITCYMLSKGWAEGRRDTGAWGMEHRGREERVFPHCKYIKYEVHIIYTYHIYVYTVFQKYAW